ncbi:MAG: methylated-DNA--[protein]-cysteine S-methyltransferase [Planctomycetales bacterium]
MTTFHSYLESPVGQILLVGDGQFLCGLYLPNHKHWNGLRANSQQDDDPFRDVRRQLTEYFAGERQQFDVPFKLDGTPFQKQVWQELARIPFGITISYRELARRVGSPSAVRAVGAANGRNPISIIVPCHRVIGANGKLTGYGGGLPNKEWLLAWERLQVAGRQQNLFDSTDLPWISAEKKCCEIL